MAAKKTGITKEDIADFRKVIEMHKEYDRITGRLAKKLSCDFRELTGEVERLHDMATASDADLCFAMGRLALDFD